MAQRDDDRAIDFEVAELEGGVPAETYYLVFGKSPEGRAVLDDLVGRFHDCELSPDPERTHDVAQAIGSRKVVGFILRRLAKITDAHPKKT